MDVQTWDKSLLLADDEPLSEELFNRMIQEVRGGERERLNFTQKLASSLEKQSSSIAKNSVKALKVVQGFYALGEFEQALEWLKKAGSGPQQNWLKGCCYKESGQYAEAIKAFEKAVPLVQFVQPVALIAQDPNHHTESLQVGGHIQHPGAKGKP